MVPRYSLILLLAFFLIGCRPATPVPTVAPVAEATATSVASSTKPEETALVRNAQYQLGLTDALRIVQLQNGKYEQGVSGSDEYVSVVMTDLVSAGDLNGDGVDEVAALIAENYSGSGVFVFLTVYTIENGTPVFLTSAIVDDRPQLNALSIANGEIALDAIIHGSNDPMCCPALRTTRHYRLLNGQLNMTDYATFTPDGRPRMIKIESPMDGTETSDAVQIKGSVAVAPFENNLTYSIKDGAGVELSLGAVAVSAAELGGPGTFDQRIKIGNIISGTVITIEIQDVSAEDGSLLSMDSVELVVK